MDFSSIPSDPLKSYLPYIISIVVGFITIIRTYMGGNSCPNSTRIDGRTVLITGASSGIGFETAKELAKRGGHIIMCCRDLTKGKNAMTLIKEKLPKAKLTLKKLDLCSTDSIRNLVNCLENFKVDILINNAGVCFHPYHITEEGHETHMSSNYLGHFLLTHQLIENLKMSVQGRIINVCAKLSNPNSMPLTTTPDEKSFASKEWFTQSKFALLLMTKYFSVLLKDTNVTVNALNPGMVRGTQHGRHSILINHWSAFLTLGPWMWLLMQSPCQGAQTSIYLATEPTLSTETGKFFSNCSEEILEIGETADAAKALYEKTCTLLKLQPMLITNNKQD